MFCLMQKTYFSNSTRETQNTKNRFEEQKMWSDFQKDNRELNLALPAANASTGYDSAFSLVLYPSVVPCRLITLLDVSGEGKLGVIFKNYNNQK